MAKSELCQSGVRHTWESSVFQPESHSVRAEGQPEFQSNPPHFLQHLGLYAYRRTFLFQLAMTKPPAMEKYEKLEQLRILALGRQIRVGITTHTAFGVDTLADYEQFVKMHRAVQARRAA